MKKILGIAALILAFSPLANAQSKSDLLASHPGARNDRNPSELRERASTRAQRHHVKHRVTKHPHRIARHPVK
ncbi:hypothetical protein BH11PSE11_BH11PSE11_01600 [soil metagenome]